ncbi:alcohol dehydrogenase catalytic domain-containing protein [Amycolatopsis sp. WQ 127309]|uniref:alcohol dehydrogenase catalytic domain-containing protein n=1 Tax=Amycolatopsis sp. WQ 127309 TaxID=2932773 RepID=UPI001FF2AB04|nr:alcohol dehydrogenase catalytic domain-containing protein [Amycolatopsis sp. WQ 127309]UOZ03433.1 alcohol dehydrogenase catalytic domain-containing protein [Amycolatopsis sp. WQ 127309]
MRALQITSWGGALNPVEVDTPEPGRGDVLVRVEACGIGLTVLNCINGQLGNDPSYLPRTPGHELVGVVEAVGDGVSSERIGERVAAYFYLVCGECVQCLGSRDSMCLNFRGNVGVTIDGGYAEYAVLPALNAISVPGAVSSEFATAIPDAIATPVHVARRAGIEPGCRVAVLAAGGGVGVHMVQVARAYGADVVGLDIVASKLAFLEQELEVPAIDSSDFSTTRLPASWHGRADVVIDLYGRAPAQRWAIDNLDRNGSLVCLTTFRDEEFSVSSRELVQLQRSVIGSRYNSRYEQGLAAALVDCGQVRPIVSETVGPAEVVATHERIRAGKVIGRAALVW